MLQATKNESILTLSNWHKYQEDLKNSSIPAIIDWSFGTRNKDSEPVIEDYQLREMAKAMFFALTSQAKSTIHAPLSVAKFLPFEINLYLSQPKFSDHNPTVSGNLVCFCIFYLLSKRWNLQQLCNFFDLSFYHDCLKRI